MQTPTAWHQKWWVVSPLSIFITMGCLGLWHVSMNPEGPIKHSANQAAHKQETAARTEDQGNASLMASTSDPAGPDVKELTNDNYLVPKTAIQFFSSGSLWWQQSGLDAEYGKAMGLDEEQIRRIDEAVRSTLDDLAHLEADHSKLVSDAEGNQFFEIGTFDGSGLQNALVSQI